MKKFMKKLAVVAIALAAAVTVAGTGLSAEAAAKKPTKITLKSTAKTVDIKGKVTVSVKSVKPSKASKSVSYKSSNKKIATVSSKGVVTGKKAGKVTITATSKVNKKVKATIKIAVKNLKPTSVSLNKSSVSLKVGGTKTLETTVKPTGVYCPVTYKSSDSAVASVDKNGKITAKKAGIATITVTTKEKNSKGRMLSKTCKVTVTDKTETTDTTNYITAADLMADMQSAVQQYKVLDVRKATDYETAHVPGTVSADVDGAKTGSAVAAATANIKAAIEKDAADTKYVLICYTGNSYAKAATTLLEEAGIKSENIYTLQGGMQSWNEKYSNYTVKTYTSTSGFTFQNGVTIDQLKADVDAENSLYTIFDLRDAVTYASGHIASAVSTPLREDNNGDDLSDDDAKANLQAGIDANPNGYYVLECYSGNKYANKAVSYLKELGVSDERIIVFEGGASAWTKADYAVTKSTVPVKYDEATKTITLYGVLNETYLSVPTKHYMSTTGATLGSKCLFEGLNDRVEFAEVLEKFGAVAWNTTLRGQENAQHGIANATGQDVGGYISETNGDNANYTHVEVSLTWSGQDTPVSMADTLTTTDGSEWPIDEVFSNSSAVTNSYGSGCLLCTCSCYAGAVTNEDMPFVSGNAIKSVGNSDVLSSAVGKIVTFTITLK